MPALFGKAPLPTPAGNLRSRNEQPIGHRTRLHYERYPFEFMTPDDLIRIEELQPAPFRNFVERYLAPGDSVADIGCGPGRATAWLCDRELSVTALDLSAGSLSLARSRAPGARCVVGSTLQLPFADESFQAVVLDGVIHHTPDPQLAFRENCRVLRPGGVLYLSVYDRQGYYYYLYTYLGRPVRWLERRKWGRFIVNVTLLPIYYLAHLVKSRGRRTWEGARNFFYDYLITPRASFHRGEEIAGWGASEGMSSLDGMQKFGNTVVLLLRKSAVRAT